jgi:hypothetical protein
MGIEKTYGFRQIRYSKPAFIKKHKDCGDFKSVFETGEEKP